MLKGIREYYKDKSEKHEKKKIMRRIERTILSVFQSEY